MMALDSKVVQSLRRALRAVDEHGTPGTRLVDDAARLWRRIQKLISLGLIAESVELDALELATYALQLPMRRTRLSPTGKPLRSTLRERAEEAAELLVGVVPEEIDEALLDRATRLLHEMPHRSPVLDESKLLADALNLDDFGVIGLALQAIQLTRQGEGVTKLADGANKREQYGYWDARLKDGFHFDAVRQIARQRLRNTRESARLLIEELADDGITF